MCREFSAAPLLESVHVWPMCPYPQKVTTETTSNCTRQLWAHLSAIQTSAVNHLNERAAGNGAADQQLCHITDSVFCIFFYCR